MPEFTQSWAFIFIIVAISFAAGFALAIIIAGSGRGSRMEERISDKAVHEAMKREKARRGGLEAETVTQGKPEDG